MRSTLVIGGILVVTGTALLMTITDLIYVVGLSALLLGVGILTKD